MLGGVGPLNLLVSASSLWMCDCLAELFVSRPEASRFMALKGLHDSTKSFRTCCVCDALPQILRFLPTQLQPSHLNAFVSHPKKDDTVWRWKPLLRGWLAVSSFTVATCLRERERERERKTKRRSNHRPATPIPFTVSRLIDWATPGRGADSGSSQSIHINADITWLALLDQ